MGINQLVDSIKGSNSRVKSITVYLLTEGKRLEKDRFDQFNIRLNCFYVDGVFVKNQDWETIFGDSSIVIKFKETKTRKLNRKTKFNKIVIDASQKKVFNGFEYYSMEMSGVDSRIGESCGEESDEYEYVTDDEE